MQLGYILSKELASRMILVHPPEPRKELLLSPVTDGIYLGKTRFLGTPVFWDYKKLINPHIAIVASRAAERATSPNPSSPAHPCYGTPTPSSWTGSANTTNG